MNNEQTTPSKPWYTKWWVIVIIIIVIFYILGKLGDKGREAVEQVQEQQAISQPVTQKTYQQIATFEGNGIKQSEPFTITGDRFKISYDCKGDLCQAFLYRVGSQLPMPIMNTTGSTKDETISYGSGEYYISANTMGSYTMTILDYK